MPEGAWAAIDLPAVPRVAVLKATDTDSAGIGLQTRFTLSSLGTADARTLAGGLSADPPIELSLARGATSRRATLVPATPLSEGTRYRFALRVRGEVVGSWQFQTRQRLFVSESIPADQATNVPVDTGIELTFNQDGVGSIAPFFTIRPAAVGTFERHGRAWVFVPEPLAPATIYTVTVRKGVPVTGSDLALEDDLTFSFETAPKATTKPADGSRDRPLPPLRVVVPHPVLEVVPGEPPVLDLWVEPPGSHDTRPVTTKVDLRVYPLPDATAAGAAVARLGGTSDWASWSDAGLVSTKSLTLAAAFTAPIRTLGEGADARDYVEFPMVLAPGWYLVVRPSAGRDTQLVLQVTDVATHITFTSTRSVLWVNDVGTSRPIAGAAIRTADGRLLGRTDAAGVALLALDRSGQLLVAAPDAGDTPSTPTPGRAAIVPAYAGWTESWYGDDTVAGYYEDVAPGPDTYWHMLDTDRSTFRSTDEIDAWGVIRTRGSGAIPTTMRARLVVAELSASDGSGLKLPDVAVRPDPRTGTFTARLPIVDLPGGDYIVETSVGSRLVDARYVRIGQILKPAYRLDLSLDRYALVEGDQVTATVRATFFDGTPVPGLDLKIDGLLGVVAARTDADGNATITARPSWDESERDGPRWRNVRAFPAGGEEADISSSASFFLLPARLVVTGDGAISGTTLAVSASVHAIDEQAADAAARIGGDVAGASSGRAVAGQPVHVRITDEWAERIKTGRRYDPITKRTYDTYRYESRETVLRDVVIETGGTGSVRLSVPLATPAGVLPAGHDYEIVLAASDRDGRSTVVRTFAHGPSHQAVPDWSNDTHPPLELGADLSEARYRVGSTIQLPVTYGSADPAPGGAFLFVSAHAGLRSVETSGEPIYRTTFAFVDMPSLAITAVWFTGRGYVTADPYWANVDRADRSLRVQIRPDRATYRPGDDVALRVRTTDLSGHPVAASVVVRAIDEKLYAIGAAGANDPYDALYAGVDSGLLGSYSSHPAPRTTLRRTWWGPQGGDTCGGGDGGFGSLLARDDFRDVVLFRSVRTAPDGTATVRFRLSDDLTSWRISGTAFSSELKVGWTSVALPVGLPLFVEASVASEYVATDRPVLRVRAFGTGLRGGEAVRFTVSAPSLGMAATTVGGTAFSGVDVQLPALTAGDHTVRITASSTGSTRYSDTLVRTIHVVASRLTQDRSSYSLLSTAVPKPTAVGATTYVFLDAGRGAYLDDLRDIAATSSDRLDSRLAASLSADLLDSEFGLGDATVAPRFAVAQYLHPGVGGGGSYGLSVLPYGSADLALTARVALVDPDTGRRAGIDGYLNEIRMSKGSTREQRLIALAGLASLGWDDPTEVEAALAVDDLTVRERLYLGLAAAHLQDYTAARAIERELLARYGQRLGPWVRLSLGSRTADAEATALLTLLALELGDPVATSTEAFVEENPSPDDLAVLQRVAFLRRALEAAPATVARFEYRLAGKRHAVTLAPGQSFRIEVPSWQLSSFTARRLAGSVGVNVSWVSRTTPRQLPHDPSLILDRSTVPSTPVPLGSTVTVIIEPHFGDFVMSGCYRVDDIVPSGLVPVEESREGVARGREDDAPVAIEGQRVTFCATPSTPQHRLIYYARVVAPGDYAWEPATIRSERTLENGTNTGMARLVVR